MLLRVHHKIFVLYKGCTLQFYMYLIPTIFVLSAVLPCLINFAQVYIGWKVNVKYILQNENNRFFVVIDSAPKKRTLARTNTFFSYTRSHTHWKCGYYREINKFCQYGKTGHSLLCISNAFAVFFCMLLLRTHICVVMPMTTLRVNCWAWRRRRRRRCVITSHVLKL